MTQELLRLLRNYLVFTQDPQRNYLELLRNYQDYLGITQDLLRNYLGITQELLRNYLGITQDHLGFTQATLELLRSYLGFNQDILRASSNLLTGGPLQGPAVDVPPTTAVTSTLLRVAGCSRKVSCLLAHTERNGAGFANRNKHKSSQY